MTISADALTLEQKSRLVVGADSWHTAGLPEAGVPAVTMSDGPNGVRKETGDGGLGVGASHPATCFPPAVTLGCSFDPGLAEQMAAAIADEARAQGVSVVLGPAVNIKRTPLCGRNFEYFSEDPLVSGRMGAAMVRGLQSRGVGASLKHFAVNNQETDRLRVSADVDARPLREIYLRAFEHIVRDAQPWTVMCSYNRVNGEFASQNHWLLTQVLRDEWGFSGLVVSDWGAVVDRVAALRAGLDLQMPGTGGRTSALVADAVRGGTLDVADLDRAVARVLALAEATSAADPAALADGWQDRHHALARQVAARGVVLLKNGTDVPLLPLGRDASIAVIGAFAQAPRFQGAGSGQINATRVDVPLDEIRRYCGDVVYAPGFTLDGGGDAASLRAEAAAVAAGAAVAVVFLGLPARVESEGYDRDGISLPADQLTLLQAVRAANPRVVVVLTNGAPVALPFRDDVPAIVEAWLPGQAGGGAIADVLFGVVNPSGRLTETIPLRLEDTPAFGNFPGDSGHVRYGEGLLVGYRWYDARDMDVAFPFGHGLSYTTFSYGTAGARALPGGDVLVTVPVTNTGRLAGREVVQVYVTLAGSAVQRPPRELKAFTSLALEAGETATASLVVRAVDLAYWDVTTDRWTVEGGTYTFAVGASSRDIRAEASVTCKGDAVPRPLTLESTMGEAMANPVVGPLLRRVVGRVVDGGADSDNAVMMASFPLGRLLDFPGVPVTPDMVQRLIGLGNGDSPVLGRLVGSRPVVGLAGWLAGRRS